MNLLVKESTHKIVCHCYRKLRGRMPTATQLERPSRDSGHSREVGFETQCRCAFVGECARDPCLPGFLNPQPQACRLLAEDSSVFMLA